MEPINNNPPQQPVSSQGTDNADKQSGHSGTASVPPGALTDKAPKSSPDTPLSARAPEKPEETAGSGKPGYVMQALAGLRNALFPPPPRPQKRSSIPAGDLGSEGLDSKGKSDNRVRAEINSAAEFGELPTVASKPARPKSVEQAMISPEDAGEYAKNTENKELDLAQLLEKVSGVKSKKDREAFFKSIFEAKMHKQWQCYALEQMVDSGDLIDEEKAAFSKMIEEASLEDSPQNYDNFKQQYDLVVDNLGLNQFNETPDARINQVIQLQFLIKQYSGLYPALDTSALTDGIDNLIEKCLPEGRPPPSQ